MEGATPAPIVEEDGVAGDWAPPVAGDAELLEAGEMDS